MSCNEPKQPKWPASVERWGEGHQTAVSVTIAVEAELTQGSFSLQTDGM